MIKKLIFLLTIAHLFFMPCAHATSDRPANYDNFVNVNNYPTVSDAISAQNYLYFPPGTYTIDNPIVIDRDTSLFLHGADRAKTIIQPANPGLPLFIVTRATLINVAGLRLDGGTGPTNADNFLFENSAPIEFEMQDSFIERSVLDIKGEGSFRVQGTYFAGRGYVNAPIVVDHPRADFLMVGGNINEKPDGSSSMVTGDQVFHAWQKQGRMRIYSTGVQQTWGVADFRIDTHSDLGAHVIANVRSEGYKDSSALSTLLYVPASSSTVNVMLMNDSIDVANPPGARFADYNGAGTLWLVGNNDHMSAGRLVDGNAPQATIVALGNHLYDNSNILPVVAQRKYAAGNIYSAGFVEPDDSLANLPPLPDSIVPLPITRPIVNSALPGMTSAATYGALGDGVTDDTAALQQWLNSGNVLYLPPGTYRTTAPLGYSHSAYGGCVHSLGGGWIAGAGSDRTRIVRDLSQKGSVFLTEGMAYMTIQGITFQTTVYDPAAPIDQPNVDLEFTGSCGPATQEMMFYDTQFLGGKYGLGIGLTTTQQGSENMVMGSAFQDASMGLALGSYNALANLVYGDSFQNNRIAMGHGGQGNAGTWAAYHTIVSGTQEKDFEIINSAGGVWYFYNFQSNSNKYFESACTGATFPFLFDHSSLSPVSPQNPVFRLAAGGGVTFLRSNLASGSITAQGCIANNTVFKINSAIPSWPPTLLNSGSRAYELALSTLDDQAPSIPTGLSAIAASSSVINLSWTASTDNIGVVGYKVFRDGVQITTVTQDTIYSDTGLAPFTTYSYTVAANDVAMNTSAQSAPVSGTTYAPDLTPSAFSASKSKKKVIVSDTVKNQGNGNAGTFTVAYYLSTNTTYEPGTDIPLASSSGGSGACTRTVTSLGAGLSSSISNKVCYKPTSAITGTRYYVLVVDDATNQVIESNKGNNVRATSGQVRW